MRRGVTPPIRRSSEGVIERVLDAVMHLLDGRRWEDIPIIDICNEAGVSHSSLYARFRSKDVILETLHERFVIEALKEIDLLATSIRLDAVPLDRAVEQIVRFAVDKVLANGTLLRVLTEQPELLSWRRANFDYTIRQIGGDLMMMYIPELSRRDAERRFEVIGRLLFAGVLRAIAPPAQWTNYSELEVEQIIKEWSELATAYVRSAAIPD